jgi:hypothetical protein
MACTVAGQPQLSGQVGAASHPKPRLLRRPKSLLETDVDCKSDGLLMGNLSYATISLQSAVGIELWSMSNDILFDNIVITDDEAHAYEWAQQTYDLKRKHLDSQAVS